MPIFAGTNTHFLLFSLLFKIKSCKITLTQGDIVELWNEGSCICETRLSVTNVLLARVQFYFLGVETDYGDTFIINYCQ